MSKLERRLRDSGTLIIDGGTGTELERRGVPMDDASWCAAALESNPETVREVHEDYINAGAEMIIANTFTTSRHILEESGLGDRFEELNRRGMELAREARERAARRPVYVAGSISTFPPRLDPAYHPPPERARKNYRDQARILAEAGADLIAFEMVRDVEHTRPALSAALETGLPVWLGFSATRDEEGKLVLWESGETLAEGVAELAQPDVSLVCVMHTLTENTPEALREIRAHWRPARRVPALRQVLDAPLAVQRRDLPRRLCRRGPQVARARSHRDRRLLRHRPRAHPAPQAGDASQPLARAIWSSANRPYAHSRSSYGRATASRKPPFLSHTQSVNALRPNSQKPCMRLRTFLGGRSGRSLR